MKFGCATLVVGAAISVAAAASPALAQPSSDRYGLGITIHKRDLGSQAGQRSAGALLQKARDRRRVRVIVGLALDLRDEDELSFAEQARQAQALGSMQNSVAWRSVIPADQVVRFETIPYISVLVTRAQLERLLNDRAVVSIQEDIPLSPMLQDSVRLIRASRLARERIKGDGMIVAVLDTGAEYSHPMLKGQVVAGFCRSGNAGASLCPGGVTSSNRRGSGRNCTFTGDCFHGTHVSSIAMGKSATLKGVARNAKLISGQVFSNDGGILSASFTDINSALERVYRLRRKFPPPAGAPPGAETAIAAVNLSLGIPDWPYNSACDDEFPATAAIINKLFRKGIATVIASGNDGFDSGISAPACIDKAIAVGSTTKIDRVSSFSNHHDLVDLMAPGSSIRAATLGGLLVTASGTSMAAPHVAGAFAVLKELRPEANVKQILNALRRGVPVGRRRTTKPRIDLVKAQRRLENILPAPTATAVHH